MVPCNANPLNCFTPRHTYVDTASLSPENSSSCANTILVDIKSININNSFEVDTESNIKIDESKLGNYSEIYVEEEDYISSTKEEQIQVSSEVNANKTRKNNIISDEIEIGKPVKWTKTVSVENYINEDVQLELKVDVPKSAEKITIQDDFGRKPIKTHVEGSDLIINDDLSKNENKNYKN